MLDTAIDFNKTNYKGARNMKKMDQLKDKDNEVFNGVMRTDLKFLSIFNISMPGAKRGFTYKEQPPNPL